MALLLVLPGVRLQAQAQVMLDKQVTIQPIIVRSDDGTVAANMNLELFVAQTQKIWAQAGIEIKFNAFQYYNSTASLNLDVDSDSLAVRGLGQVTGQTWSSTSTTVIKMFFVQSLGSGVLGYTDQSTLSVGLHGSLTIQQNTAVAISDVAFAYNGGQGRIDVIAHELGHALGLGESIVTSHDFFVGDHLPHNLMVAGNVRNSPTSIGDIYPDGAGFDQLNGTIGGINYGDDISGTDGGQIDRARAMPAVVANTTPHFYVYASLGFATWQQSKFTASELSNASISGPNAIYGQDGLPNLVKYALGLEPKQNITTSLPSASTIASDWVYTYTKPATVTDLTYSVEVSTDLVSWSASGVTLTMASSSGGIETWQAKYPLASAANVFFRLKVTH